MDKDEQIRSWVMRECRYCGGGQSKRSVHSRSRNIHSISQTYYQTTMTPNGI